MKEKMSPQREVLSRRKAITTTGKGLAYFALSDQLPKLIEVTRPQGHVHFIEGQKRRLPSKRGVLVLGGFNIGEGEQLAKDVEPGLSPEGPIMAADYAGGSLDISSLGDDLLDIKRKEDIKELSVYCQSGGGVVAGSLVEQIGDSFRFPNFFLDDTPVNLNDTRFKNIATFLTNIPSEIYHGGLYLNMLINSFAFHNPLYGYAAYPDLEWDQMAIIRNGKKYMTSLSEIVKRDRSNVNFFRPRNPEKDSVIFDAKTERDLRTYFPNMRVFLLDGNQGHANPGANREAYYDAFRRAIALGRR